MFFSFKTLHRQDGTNMDIFRSSVDDLLDFFLAGFNVSLFLMGESGSGKTYTLAGEGTTRAGIVPMIFDTLFTRLHGGYKSSISSKFIWKTFDKCIDRSLEMRSHDLTNVRKYVTLHAHVMSNIQKLHSSDWPK